jgi:hypothetical protein
MKKLQGYTFYLLLLFVQLLPSAGFAQKKKEVIKTLFYNLPIDLTGQNLVQELNNNPTFTKLKSIDSSSTAFGYNYLGSINLKDFPSSLKKPESATLKLTGSLGYMVDSKKDYESSDLTVEYLFTSEELAETYFTYAWDKLKSLAKDTSDAQFGLRDEEDFSYGKSIKLIKRKMLPEIYVLKREFGNKMYVSIIYRREGY